MATYVYRRKPSTGAMDLAEALDAVRFRGRTLPIERKVRRGDRIIAWGETVPAIPGVDILNGTAIQSKYQDALRLKEAGVSTITVALRPEPPTPQVTPVDPAIGVFERARELSDEFADLPADTNIRSTVFTTGLAQLNNSITNLTRALMVPAPVAAPVVQRTWIPRKNDHVGGDDLLAAPQNPDYWAVRENIVKEFRVHSFQGKSIRAGVKALRDGFVSPETAERMAGLPQTASNWIRSWDGGWRIKYDGVSSKQKHRDLAHAAVTALGLDFGAVDIGERADGSLIVLEVNRAPGLAEGTIDRYVTAIQGWMNGAA